MPKIFKKNHLQPLGAKSRGPSVHNHFLRLLVDVVPIPDLLGIENIPKQNGEPQLLKALSLRLRMLGSRAWGIGGGQGGGGVQGFMAFGFWGSKDIVVSILLKEHHFTIQYFTFSFPLSLYNPNILKLLLFCGAQ